MTNSYEKPIQSSQKKAAKRYSRLQLVFIKAALAPGQNLIGTGGFWSVVNRRQHLTTFEEFKHE